MLLFSFLHRVPVRGALRFCRYVPDFSFWLISGLIVFQYTIKQVHGLKTEYYLGVGDFIVAPRSFEFRFLPQRNIVHVRSSFSQEYISVVKFTPEVQAMVVI